MQSLPPCYISMDNYTPKSRASEIHSITVMNLDVQLKRSFHNTESPRKGGGLRSEITKLSDASRRRLISSARNIPNLTTMITFTFPHEDYAIHSNGNFMYDGEFVKNCCRKLRQALVYRGLYGFWFLEFQKRGAPHFHFIVSGAMQPSEVSKLKRTWHRMVGSSCPHHLERGVKYEILRKQSAAGSYAAKYSSKDEQKTVPPRYQNVGRFWGLFGKNPASAEPTKVRLRHQDLYKIARVARNYEKSQARANGYKIRKRDKGDGYGGTTFFSSAPVLLQYLRSAYISRENLEQIVLLSRPLRSPVGSNLKHARCAVSSLPLHEPLLLPSHV